MDLRQLRYFTAIVEAGSLTAAAAQLHISQPPLSVAMAKLETEVGVALLTRTSRGVEPTSAGRYLMDASSRVLGDVDDIVSALKRFGSGVAGSLTMAVVPVLMWHRLPQLLREYAAELPDVEMKLVDPPPWTAIDMLQQRTVDLAAIVVAEPQRFIRRHRENLDIIDWGEIPLVGAFPPDAFPPDASPASAFPPVTSAPDTPDTPDPLPLRTFDGRVVVLPRRTAAVPSLPEAVEDAFRRHGVAPASIRTVETIQASLPLIEAGLACAVLPDPDRRSLSRFDVTVRRLRPEPTPLRALVLTRADATNNAALSLLLERISGAARPIARDNR